MLTTISSPSILILHLSDLHFGHHNRFQDLDIAQFGSLFSRAVQQAQNELGWTRSIDIVIVSGDVAEQAKPKEFERGNSFLRSIATDLSVAIDRFVFVPGNHDFSWAECKKVYEDQKTYEFNDTVLNQKIKDVKFKFYDDFLRMFYSLGEDETLAVLPGRTELGSGTGAFLHDISIGDFPISIAALNTCEFETHVTPGGQLGESQAQALIEAWTIQKNYARSLKIAVIHHNPEATPPANVKWTEEWFKTQIRTKKLKVSPEWLHHYTVDLAGFRGKEYLKNIVRDGNAHLVLHGHHHTPDSPTLWKRKEAGTAPVLSVGSFALDAKHIPTDQPLTCQLIGIQVEPEPRMVAVPMEFDPNYRMEGTISKGQFRLNLKAASVYEDAIHLPSEWILSRQPQANNSGDQKINEINENTKAIREFVTYYRTRTRGLYSSYDLRNLAVVPTEMHKTHDPKLDELYLPLRFATAFDINQTDAGAQLDLEQLMTFPGLKSQELGLDPVLPKPTRRVRATSRTRRNSASEYMGRALIALTGAAGTGKTTWMRYTFRRMRDDSRCLPFLVELRSVAAFWEKGGQRSIEGYLINWLENNAPGFRDSGVSVSNLLASTEWVPFFLVDGWDELGEIGTVFREQLLGIISQYPRLNVVVTSRPYGTARPSNSDGFKQLQVQPLSPAEIQAFTWRFYSKCYEEDDSISRKRTDEFEKALMSSPDCRLMAKTPLLLTMMLFINRSRHLPDQRHQLYQE